MPRSRSVQTVHAWAADAIVYQIFPDRFFKTSPCLKYSEPFQRWGASPNRQEFMGGTLRGIIRRLNHIQDLGANTLYLTPIFLASANHRYNTYDYFTIDPRLGTLQDFQDLVNAVHERGMRLILDGVFNHCGRGFFPFYDVMERGKASPYASWFHVKKFPVTGFGPCMYRGWQGRPFMPILNLHNPHTRQYCLDVVTYWMKLGIDGWRLDAVADVPGHQFWKAVCRTVKKINPNAYLVAELWKSPRLWIRRGEFDGATNYEWRQVILDYFIHATIPTRTFLARITRLHHRIPTFRHLTMLNLLGSHDTERIYSVAQGNLQKLQLIFFFLFVYPGIPAIYYGDEIGMEGGPDPDNRRGMEWSRKKWETSLYRYVRRLAAIRTAVPSLRRGDWQVIPTPKASPICAFFRRDGRHYAVILLNSDSQPGMLTLEMNQWVRKAPKHLFDRMTGTAWPCRNGRLVINPIPGWSGMILTQG